VITLQMTKNKMPRWLSEGISVYEERQANPAWGERMNPQYREMILGDDLQPISKLSGAFLSPPSDLHLQFAYYESSLVVEFLVQNFGLESLKAILRDLGEGLEINEAIAKRTEPMPKLESEFAEYARTKARNLAPGLDWAKLELKASNAKGQAPDASSSWSRGASLTNSVPPQGVDEAWEAWARTRPTNFWVMLRRAEESLDAKNWPQAKAVLEKLVMLYPDSTGTESTYRMLAAAHRALGETNSEREVLTRFAARDPDAIDAYRRLMELGAAAHDWQTVAENARRYIAVEPMTQLPYRFLAQASEQMGQTDAAIAANRAVLELDPSDPAQVHFDLARLLHKTGSTEARRQVLQALEEAPRFREALRLLLDIEKTPEAGGT
jgi:tetratricopeptide (TPR) repeat protein